jgi:hypothetical protein
MRLHRFGHEYRDRLQQDMRRDAERDRQAIKLMWERLQPLVFHPGDLARWDTRETTELPLCQSPFLPMVLKSCHRRVPPTGVSSGFRTKEKRQF